MKNFEWFNLLNIWLTELAQNRYFHSQQWFMMALKLNIKRRTTPSKSQNIGSL